MKQQPCQRGQAIVEFALVIPLLLLLVVGIVEFGRLATQMLTLRHGSYSLVRAAAVAEEDAAVRDKGLTIAGTVVPNAGAYSEWYASDPVTGTSVYVVRYSDDGDDQWVEMRLGPIFGERKQGDPVAVQFDWGFRPIFLGWILPEGATYTIRAVGRVEYPPQ